jgi:hypothetical protein
MHEIHSQSDAAYRVRSPEAVREATRVLGLIDAMGLLKLREPITSLQLSLLREAANAAAQRGIGQHAAAVLAGPQPNRRVVLLALRQLAEALEDSPLPDSEARELARVFGWDPLALMVHSSPASLRRYASTLREAPDDVAGRLHWLAKVVGDLRGAYNDAGIRRWFDRPRVQLQGQAPNDLLHQEWTPDQPEIAAVRSLSTSLAGAGAA